MEEANVMWKSIEVVLSMKETKSYPFSGETSSIYAPPVYELLQSHLDMLDEHVDFANHILVGKAFCGRPARPLQWNL